MNQLDNIEQIEKRLWSAADTLRQGSNFASNEYFLPVMGLIFLRHAYSRYLMVREEIETTLPVRGGKKRALTKEDFARKSSLYLQEQAQFEYLVNLPSEKDRAKAIINAMERIEDDYESLKGVLPKSEYQELDNDVLGNLLRTFNDSALHKASGDIFGRIYEYFLTGFADLKAHDGGEFFTPQSLVQMIVNIIEPEKGKVIDPACGSGGMFVQSAHFIESHNQSPSEKVVFYGMEKNPTTIRLAKMNLAVHGLEGDIKKAITYYEDPHQLIGKADFVMANPPFNVNEVDADKIKEDPRLPFGLPGVNTKDKISNGNYLWISYFYSYLSEKGRAGFVMSSQASSATNTEADVRRKLVQTGHVDVMMAIRGGFFYTRIVPCELWFFDKAKTDRKTADKILMIDARNVNRKVTRVIYDFSPEQQKNLTAIVWLYRGECDRFAKLISEYFTKIYEATTDCDVPLKSFWALLTDITQTLKIYISQQLLSTEDTEQMQELNNALHTVKEHIDLFNTSATSLIKKNKSTKQVSHIKHTNISDIKTSFSRFTSLLKNWLPIFEQSKDMVQSIDLLYKLLTKNKDIADNVYSSNKNEDWNSKEIAKRIKRLDGEKKVLIEKLKLVRYFYTQVRWLLERFPHGVYKDVEGLCKLVAIKEIEKNDWSLTPGRYVGVAPEEEDENFDFEETMRDIHYELKSLNDEALVLAEKIEKNYGELGI